MNVPSPEQDDRHLRLRELVDRADELPSTEWPAFVKRECPTDPTLRADVLRLLDQLRRVRARGFLELAAAAMASTEATEDYRPREPLGDSPTSIGKYQDVRRFAEASGQASAYLAFDPDLERHVVLKRYHGESGEAEEGRALAKVASPFVARCYGVERIEGEPYLIVEYIPGRNLGEFRRDGPVDLARVVRIVTDLAEGVAAVHARGLIHRDIKPSNVILHDDGKPRLVDFGLAAHLGSPRLRQVAGSPSYMAPEQVRGHGDRIDHRVDVFGLGGVLYALLTGRSPYECASTLGSTLEALAARKAEFPTPRRLDPKVPAPIEAVCLKAMAAAPENRHGSALEFARDLRRAWLLVRLRRLLPAAAAALVLLLGAAAWFWPEGSALPPAAAADGGCPRRPPQPDAGPIEAEIVVTHYKDQGWAGPCPGGRRGVGAGRSRSTPPRFKDLVRVRVTLSRPAFGYPSIAFEEHQRQGPALPTRGQPIPEHAGAGARLPLRTPRGLASAWTDGGGVQAFVLVASDRPLPDICATRGSRRSPRRPPAWSPPDGDAFWTFDDGPPASEPGAASPRPVRGGDSPPTRGHVRRPCPPSATGCQSPPASTPRCTPWRSPVEGQIWRS